MEQHIQLDARPDGIKAKAASLAETVKHFADHLEDADVAVATILHDGDEVQIRANKGQGKDVIQSALVEKFEELEAARNAVKPPVPEEVKELEPEEPVLSSEPVHEEEPEFEFVPAPDQKEEEGEEPVSEPVSSEEKEEEKPVEKPEASDKDSDEIPF